MRGGLLYHNVCSSKEGDIGMKCLFVYDLTVQYFTVPSHALTENFHSLLNIHCNIQYNISVPQLVILCHISLMLTPQRSIKLLYMAAYVPVLIN